MIFVEKNSIFFLCSMKSNMAAAHLLLLLNTGDLQIVAGSSVCGVLSVNGDFNLIVEKKYNNNTVTVRKIICVLFYGVLRLLG